jgi:SAM-dependent methyltransferase
VVGCDGSLGMLRAGAAGRPPAVVGDALALPVRDGAFDLAVAGFVLNHLPDPTRAAREMARVVRPAGRVVATTFAGEVAEDVKSHLDAVAGRHGWVKPSWYLALRDGPLFRPSSDSARAVLVAAGLSEVRVERVVVRVSLTPDEVLAWRWGMAHLAPFVTGLPMEQRHALDAEARAGLPASGSLEFPVLVMAGQASS